MRPAKMRAAVKLVPAKIMTEASGNINLKTVRGAGYVFAKVQD